MMQFRWQGRSHNRSRYGSSTLNLVLVVLVVMLSSVISESKQVDGIQVFYDWSRRIFDFVGSSSSIVRKLLSGAAEPVTTRKLIEQQGYPSETHHVTTDDGYILEMHRIPYGVHPRGYHHQPESRIPVLLGHGNAQSSADWVINTPRDDALGFYLADSGYDVWLLNQRGNDYSSRHVSLTSSSSAFWNYSMHESGLYDMPAMIDYIIEVTGHPRVHFVGFSLSNAAFLVTLTKRPEYNSKLGVGILLAPAVFLQDYKNGFGKIISPLAFLYQVFDNFLGGLPLIPPFIANLLHRVLPVICHRKVDVFGLCIIVFRILFGNDRGLISNEKMSLITSVAPTPSFSVKVLMHGMQLMGSGEFQEYDYGISRNREVYGRARPPDYNLTNVRIPISIMAGPQDILASPKDARTLANRLPNLNDLYFVKDSYFTHHAFCYAQGTGKLVYSRVVQILNSFSPLPYKLES